MSGDLSASFVTPGMVAADSVMGTKRPPEEGLALSDSKLDDCGYLDCVYDDDFIRESYVSLTSNKLFLSMICGRVRLDRLLMLSKETDLSDQLIVRIKGLQESFTDLLSSKTKLGTTKDLVEKSRLVQLAKQILREWEGIESAIPPPQVDSLSWWCMAPIDYPPVVPSAWLFERRWRDMAYEEIVSLKKKYSCFLDQAYRDSYLSYTKKKVFGSVDLLSRKKLLKFVASSREDLDFMGLKQCYKRVMAIKEFCIPKKQPLGLVSKCATQNSVDQIQLPNWRDEIYDQIVASRKMYSLMLDELLRDEVKKMKSSGTEDNARRSFLEESLQFLAMYRDGVALVSEAGCRKQLAAIKHFMEEEVERDSVSAAAKQQATQLGNGLINWRDLEYEELKVKAIKFVHLLYDEQLINKAAWSKMPACEDDLKALESKVDRLVTFYNMKRGEMALLYESKECYYSYCWDHVQKLVQECGDLVGHLLGRLEEGKKRKPSWFCHVEKMVPLGSDLVILQCPIN